MKYKQLDQKHPEYVCDDWKRLRLLRKGGYAILREAKQFIPKLPKENDERYQFRLKHAAYVPYFAQCLAYLTGSLHSSDLVVRPVGDEKLPSDFYEEFEKNADLRGKPFPKLVQSLSADALTYGRALIGIDFPKRPKRARLANRAAEEPYARAYCFPIPLEALTNWARDEVTGEYTWAVIREELSDRATPYSEGGKKRIRFTHWEMGRDGAEWTRYETAPFENGSPPETVTLVDSGKTSFQQIPIVELRVPDEFWLGSLIGPLCEDHFRTRSELRGTLAATNVEIPVVKQAPEVGGFGEPIPSPPAQDPDRGENAIDTYRQFGVLALGSGDSLSFEGPKGTAITQTASELSRLQNEIYRVANCMGLAVDPTTAARTRASAESKREDRNTTEKMLSEIASMIRSFATTVHRVVSEARGETVDWETKGLDQFDLSDSSTLADSVLVKALEIPSKTFDVEYYTGIATTLTPNAQPSVREKIRTEIQESFEAGDTEEDKPAVQPDDS